MAPPSPLARPTSILTSFRPIFHRARPRTILDRCGCGGIRMYALARTWRRICPEVTQGQPVTKREFSPRTSASVESTLGPNKITCTYRPDTRTGREPAPVHVRTPNARPHSRAHSYLDSTYPAPTRVVSFRIHPLSSSLVLVLFSPRPLFCFYYDHAA
jgi:hypothetical protein